MLDEFERYECGDGYLAECPRYCKCPRGVTARPERELLNQWQRNRHETVNERFKDWGCMRKKFRHSEDKHRTCSNCVAVLTQLAIEHGEELFDLDYDDTLTDIEAGLQRLAL